MTPGRRIVWWVTGLATLVGIVVERALTLARAAPTDFDDAYMYLRYARHLLAGHGMAWNIGQGNVYGVTSLLHLGAVTVTAALFPRLPAAGVLQVASGAAALALLAGLATVVVLLCVHARLRDGGILCAVAVVALVAVRDAFVFHAGSGMDTMLSALANTAVVLATVQLARAPTVGTAAWAATACLGAVLARPENVVCAVLCPLLALSLASPASRAKPTVTFVVSLIPGLAALALITKAVLGSPVPLSFFAKQPGYYGDFAGEYGWNPFLFLKTFLATAWPFVATALVFASRKSWRSLCYLLAPALVTIAVLFRFNQIMGHLGRFYYPFLPFFVAAGMAPFGHWLGRHASWRDVLAQLLAKSTAVRAVAVAALVVGGSLGLSRAADAFDARAQEQLPVRNYVTKAQKPLPEMDSWQAAHAVAAMAAAAPTGISFAMSEHGLPGALASDVHIVDLLGLHDPYFARHGFSAIELFRRKPDVIWLPHPDHGAMVRAILESDELWQHYDVFPDAWFFGIAVQTDGPAHTELAALFRQQWDQAYPQYEMEKYRARRIVK